MVPNFGSKCHRSPRGYLDENSQGGWGLWFVSLCITAVFVVDLYVGLPPLLSQTVGHRGTSPVKLTSHFPEAKTPTTLTFDGPLTVSAARRRSFKGVGPPCFTESRWLALRRGRIVFPPQVLFPGSFATTFYGDTSCVPPLLKFEKQVLDRYGPAQVGFNRHCGDLTVYSERTFVLPRLSSQALRLTQWVKRRLEG